MEPIEFIAPWYYSTAYFTFFLVVSWITTIYHLGSNGQKVLYAENNGSQGVAVLLMLLVSFFVGLRQLTRDFGDTRLYAGGYNYIKGIEDFVPFDFKTEWFWHDLEVFCRVVLGLNAHEFFVLVALVFFGGMLICCIILTRENLWLSMLFFYTALQTFTFSVNGIRNGMACSIVLIAVAMIASKKKVTIGAIILMFLGLGIHRSTMLPSAAVIASLFYVKDKPKLAFRFWILSIVISLVAGPAVERFFAALGFDDRMSSYHNAQFDEDVAEVFSSTGFRWDFLLYSTFPVLMIWYVIHRRRFNDPTYNILASTYILCNAFWIMVIRAAFSNRFAYLSWFLYPIVMCYPLLRMNMWEDQDRRTSIIFFAYTGFTFFMFFVYYFGTTGFRGFDLYWWRQI